MSHALVRETLFRQRLADAEVALNIMKFKVWLTYSADSVDSFPLLGVVFTDSNQPVALLVNHRISKPELAVFWCDWLDIAGLAG